MSLKGFEKAAVDQASTWEGICNASIAISLKRIADNLDGFNMDGFRNQLLEIAYQASLNFKG